MACTTTTLLASLFTLLAVGKFVVAQDNATLGEGDLQLKILGRSGGFVLTSKKNESNFIKMGFDEVAEYSSDGKPADKRHIYRNFAKTDFQFGDLMNGTKYGLDAKSISFGGYLKDVKANMNVTVVVFQESGEITGESGEEYQVGKGAVKFNIEINNWDFCTAQSCKKVGDYLEFNLKVRTGVKVEKIKKAKKQIGKKGKKGSRAPVTEKIGNSDATFSPLVRVDGTWTEMPEGYPKSTVAKGGLVYTFRFPKGKEIFYDPVMELNGGDSTGAAVSVKSSAVMAVTLAFIATLLLGRFH